MIHATPHEQSANQENEQYSFAQNGNIMPCPYRTECGTYGIGCGGVSHWCGQKGIKYDCKHNNDDSMHHNTDDISD